MSVSTRSALREHVPALLRGEGAVFAGRETGTARLLFDLAVIILGAGAFGAAMGCWRSPEQALYTAAKLPLVLLLTALGNALLNGMLAPLLGVDLRFRESLLAILRSFTIAAAILGAFSPVAAFLIWNAPPLSADLRASSLTFNFIQIIMVAMIAYAGVGANLRLMQALQRRSGRVEGARCVLFAWLAGNLFLGSQLGWILRPFFGSPNLPVEFLRRNAFEGNFYETLFHAAKALLTS